MGEVSLLLVFFYGVLHAFGPDHLTAIADFSIGRQRKRVLWISFGFAIGHGVSLYLFAWLLSQFDISDELLAYGDMIAAIVILLMGFYLLFLVFTDRINLSVHKHGDKEHLHIWFGKHHSHSQPFFGWLSASATLGVLMGIGGARGMLVSLSAISHETVTAWMIVSFTLGVGLIFVLFGLVIAFLNDQLLRSKQWVKGGFTFFGILSCALGVHLLL
jgi:ABC-type nickel/cobalt efflux system permease component RcnA